MSGVNPLFQAHMLLFKWGKERLAREATKQAQQDQARVAADLPHKSVSKAVARG